MNHETNNDFVDLALAGPSDAGERSDLMNPATRDRLLSLLAALGQEWPTMRFGQLVCALVSSAEAAVPGSIYDVEDVELLAAVEKRLALFRADK